MSTIKPSNSLVTYEIKVEDTPLNESIEITKINSISSLEKANKAIIDIALDLSNPKHPLEDPMQILTTDKSIKILIGYECRNNKVFEGFITSQNIKADINGSLLTIECQSKKNEIIDQIQHNKSELSLTYGVDILSFNGKYDGNPPRLFKGEVSIQGNAETKIGNPILIEGLKSSSPVAPIFATSVSHSVQNGNWISSIQFETPKT